MQARDAPPKQGEEAKGPRTRIDVAREEVRKLTSGEGLDVVIDSVGQDTFAPSLKLLAKGGRYVTCGATSGFEMSADFRRVFFN